MNNSLSRSSENAFLAWMHYLDSFYHGNANEQRAVGSVGSAEALEQRVELFIGERLRSGGAIRVTTGMERVQDVRYGADLPPNTTLTFTEHEPSSCSSVELTLFDPLEQAALSLSGIARVLGHGGTIQIIESPSSRF